MKRAPILSVHIMMREEIDNTQVNTEMGNPMIISDEWEKK